jgi:hypothetical protein
MASTDPHVNFDAPAILRKWPSVNNERRTEGPGPYLLVDGTLDECIREYMANCRNSRKTGAHEARNQFTHTTSQQNGVSNKPSRLKAKGK